MQVKRSSMLPGSGRVLSELSQMSVRELAVLARTGEREAFDPLFRRFSGRLLVWALRRTDGDRMLAEDVVSETWTTAVRAIGRWKDDGTEEGFARWLFGIAHAARGQAFTGRWREVASDNTELWEAIPASVDGECHEPAGKQAMVKALHAAIGTLSKLEQSVVRMRLDGVGQAEIARKLGRTPKQVDDAWRQAQVRLRRQLAGPVDVQSCSEQERARLREAAQSLAPRMRQVALLRLAGLQPAEVASRLGLDRDQERRAWQRARDLLVRHISDPAAAQAKATRGAIPINQRDELLAAAQSLAPRMRQIALMRLEGMRPSEIERRLGCSHNVVRAGWQRARDAFARQGLMATT